MEKQSRRSSALSVRSLTYGALFVAFLAVLSQLFLPTPLSPAPITLQTLGLMLCAFFLRPVNALFSTTAYVLLGAAGVPVFYGFTGGLGKIMGPTGGFILAFPLIVFLLSLCLQKAAAAGRQSKSLRWLWRVIGLLVFHALLYAFACLWHSLQTGVTAVQAAAVLVVPFLVGDAVKSVVFVLLIPLLQKRLHGMNPQGGP